MAIAFSLLVAQKTLAATPTFSFSNVSGDSVQINVNGDANSVVNLYYNVAYGSGLQMRNIGSTSGTGSLTTTVSTSNYGAQAGYLSYVVVNSQQSQMIAWPSSTQNTAPSLTQTNLGITTGQSVTVSSYASNSSVYILNNSNPSVASVVANGTQIVVTAINYGYTTASVCYQGNSTNCASLSVNVNGSSGSQTISFSQNNLFISSGQNQTINIYGNGGYTMSSNSNPGAVNVTLGVSTLTVYAVSTGSANITVCQQNNAGCGTLYVTVNGSSNGQITFSQVNPYVPVGQSINVTVYGGTTNNYYINNNSNSNVASPNLSGSNLTIMGNSVGSTSLVICSSSSICGTLYITVTSSGSSTITFSQTNPTLTVGQALSVNVYGGSGMYYVQSNSASGVAQATVSGGTVNLTGLIAGSTNISVCSSNGGACNTLYVTVSGNSSGSALSLSTNSLSLSVGQNQTVYIYGSGSYYISSTPNSSVATMTLSGNNLTVNATGPGSTSATVCQTSGQCGLISIYSSVSGSSGAVTFSQQNPNLTVGQTLTLTLYGGNSGSYYLQNNSASGVVQTSVGGNTLTLTGLTNGSATLTLCLSSGGCSPLYVTVGASGNNGNITFSTSNPTLNVGQTMSVYVYGGSGSYHLQNNSASNIAQVTLGSNTLTLVGSASGSGNLGVCDSNNNCGSLYLTVGGTVSNSITFSQQNPNLNVGQTQTVTISGGSGSYYLQYAPNNLYQASISGNAITLTGSSSGSASLSVCSTSGGCGQLNITVGSSLAAPSDVSAMLAQVQTLESQIDQLQKLVAAKNAMNANNGQAVGNKHKFYTPLKYGSRGQEVIYLQQRLSEEGFYVGPITGQYGAATLAAVKRYQSNHGLKALGNLGPGTRAELNK